MIYFVQLDSGAIKIGSTKAIKSRMAQIAHERGTSITLLATLEGGREEELKIHERFAHLRMGRTEQFAPAADLMEFIGLSSMDNGGQDRVAVQPLGKGVKMPFVLRLSDRALMELRELMQITGLSRTDVVETALIELWERKGFLQETS